MQPEDSTRDGKRQGERRRTEVVLKDEAGCVGAAGAAVLTHRFWTTEFQGDSSIIGRTVRLGTRSATIIGVVEPSVPYPSETEIIANVVTSPHHLDATMVDGRVHRMTELFGRLAPGADLESARASIEAAETGVRAATEAQRVLSERFAAGVATNLDVLDAQVALLQAGLDLTRARASTQLAAARLDRALGR